MYARLARSEGSEPEVLKREIEDMRNQIEGGMSDESMREMTD